MANGDFSASLRQNIQLRTEEMFTEAGNPQVRHMSDDLGTAKALLMNQTANVGELTKSDEDNTVKISWMENNFADAVEDCTTACDFTGPRAETLSQTYTLADCVQEEFSVGEEIFRTNTHDATEEMSRWFMKADYRMAQKLNTESIAFVDANKGTSVYAPAGSTNDANGVVIPAANWTSSIAAQFQLLSKYNNFPEAFAIGGQVMYLSEWLAALDTSDGAEGRRARIANLETYYDLTGLLSDATNPMYIINSSSYALAVKNRYTGFEDLGYEGRTRSTFNSNFIPGLTYDVLSRKHCGTDEETITEFKLKARVGKFLAPQDSQNATNTGIIKLKQS